MKKFLSSSLIAFIIIANLFAPISIVFNKKNNNFNVKKSVASAAGGGINLTVIPIRGDNYINLKIHVNYVLYENTSEGVKVVLKNTINGNLKEPKYPTVSPNSPPILNGKNINNPDAFYTTVEYNDVKFENLNPNTRYEAIVTVRQVDRFSVDFSFWKAIKEVASPPDKKGFYIEGLNIKSNLFYNLWGNGDAYKKAIKDNVLWEVVNNISVNTLQTGETEKIGNSIQKRNENYAPDIMPSCTLGDWSVGGCVAQFIYAAIFVPSSYLFALSGSFFDNTFNYSVQSSSYKSEFVVQGWNIVRDFVNMFFIFVLLYIAFSTILNINGSKTKEMIVNVIIIGLLINFSLFATRVIIDTSNILARVFYNTNTIKITDVSGPDASGLVTALNPNGVIPLSSALINKVNPQSLIINAGKVGSIPDKGGQTNTSSDKGVSTGTFILVTLLSSAINIIGFIVFLTVGLLFIIRVVGLWLAMILAPFAFFSYTVPAMQDIDMVGWKKWWPETIKLAFMAPVFIFFIYLILQFLNSGLGIMDTTSAGLLSFILRIIIPFAFIMVLLMKAKDIAVKLSGEMGKSVSKAGSAIGGMALGAATGGASMAMRGTVGKLGSSIANSERLKRAETRGVFGSKMLRNIGNTAQNKSFDFRNTKLGTQVGKKLGVDFSKANKGGFKQIKEENIEKRVKRAKELEVGEDSNATQLVRQRERELEAIKTDPEIQNTLIELNNGMGGLERALSTRQRELADAERNLRDVINVSGADSNEADTARMEQARAVTRRDIARRELEVRQQDIRDTERPIHDAENNLSLAKNNEIGINRERREAYANTIQGGWSNAINNIISFNEHSNLGEREAANKILSGIKEGERLRNTE